MWASKIFDGYAKGKAYYSLDGGLTWDPEPSLGNDMVFEIFYNTSYVNQIPVANIDSIFPNPVQYGVNVFFEGHGIDTDGTITNYNWISDIDGLISTERCFNYSDLSVGTHKIKFKVKDNLGTWSPEDIENLMVLENNNTLPTAFIMSIDPNPANENDIINFIGYGEDPDGEIINYEWNSNVDMQLYLGTNSSFNITSLSKGEHTISLRVQDDDLEWSDSVTEILIINNHNNNPPNAPTISGPSSGKININYNYTFNSIDPDGDEIYYHVQWGDTILPIVYGPYLSGEDVILNHSWGEKNTYSIIVKAVDIYDAESDYANHEIKIPKNNQFYLFFYFLDWLFEKIPILEKIMIFLQ